MNHNNSKVDLESLKTIFESEVQNNIKKGKTVEESSQIFGIKFAPLLEANAHKFTIRDVIQISKYNSESVLRAAENGISISECVILETSIFEEKGLEKLETSKPYSPNWFNEKGREFQNKDIEAKELYEKFSARFSPKSLLSMAEDEIADNLFLCGNYSNMCYCLEYKNNELFGGIKGGNAFKFPIHKGKKDGQWKTGSPINTVVLSKDEKDVRAKYVRDFLIKSVSIIERGEPFDSDDKYLTLEKELSAADNEIIRSTWILKYYHMLFPETFPTFYSETWQRKILGLLGIDPLPTVFGRLGQINQFVKKCGISNVVFAQVIYKYCPNLDVEESSSDLDDNERVGGGQNIILYGVPGAGKSWTIKNEYCNESKRIERVVFHPDYTYADFVGQILPKVKEDTSLAYEFTPGPFTNLLKKAYCNPNEEYFLIIEEINRGNAPAIFGDIFQLLDRDENGSSEYEITNTDIAKIVYGDKSHKVSIPSNMSIICTMNTSDQNVFTLDTAFQRRWNMRQIKNQFSAGVDEELANTKILDTTVTWKQFLESVNDIILADTIGMTSSEDKRLGTHFISISDLKYNEDNEKQNRKFAEKVIKYLWDDAFKFSREKVFDVIKYKSLEEVIIEFIKHENDARFDVFIPSVRDAFIKKA